MNSGQTAVMSRTHFAGASSLAYPSASARSCECAPNTRSAAVALPIDYRPLQFAASFRLRRRPHRPSRFAAPWP